MSVDSVLRLAVAAADRALASDSGSAETWLTQAMVSQSVDPTDAVPIVRAARRAVTLDSTYAPAWHGLAMAQADSGDLDGALATWRQCTRVDPVYTQCLVFLALGLFWHGRFDEAARWADSAVAIDPTYLTARTTAGSVAIERGAAERAAAAFDAARRLSADVELVNSLAGGATAAARRGDVRAARRLLQRAESLSTAYEPPPLHTVVYLAVTHAALHDVAGALAWLERYTPTRDLHFQLHLACDPPFASIRSDGSSLSARRRATRCGS